MTLLKDSATQYITLKKQGSPPSGTPATNEMFLYSDETTIELKLDDDSVVTLLTSTGGAPASAPYITQTPHSGLSSEQALSALTTGLVKNTTGTGILSIGVAGTDYAAASHNHNASDINAGTLVHERGGFETDVSAYDGYIRISGGTTSNIKSTFSSSTAPTINDDTGDGFVVGSRWLDTSNDREYICLDNASGAAIWLLTTLVNSLAGDTIEMAALRTITNSNDSGAQGEICFDANYAYFCVAVNTWKRVALSTW